MGLGSLYDARRAGAQPTPALATGKHLLLLARPHDPGSRSGDSTGASRGSESPIQDPLVAFPAALLAADAPVSDLGKPRQLVRRGTGDCGLGLAWSIPGWKDAGWPHLF